MAAQIKLRVTDDCMGVANCVGIAPELFALDDDGLSTVMTSEVPADLLDRAERAMVSCPTGAIVKVEDPLSPVRQPE